MKTSLQCHTWTSLLHPAEEKNDYLQKNAEQEKTSHGPAKERCGVN